MEYIDFFLCLLEFKHAKTKLENEKRYKMNPAVDLSRSKYLLLSVCSWQNPAQFPPPFRHLDKRRKMKKQKKKKKIDVSVRFCRDEAAVAAGEAIALNVPQ